MGQMEIFATRDHASVQIVQRRPRYLQETKNGRPQVRRNLQQTASSGPHPRVRQGLLRTRGTTPYGSPRDWSTRCPLWTSCWPWARSCSTPKRLTVGTCVVPGVPLRNPAVLAKETATLDFLSGGRVVLGCGCRRVFELPDQMRSRRVRGRPPSSGEQSRRRDAGDYDQAVDGRSPVSHKGRFHSFENIEMGPVRLFRNRIPPLWTGGEAEGVLRRAARWCQGFVPSNPRRTGVRSGCGNG